MVLLGISGLTALDAWLGKSETIGNYSLRYKNGEHVKLYLNRWLRTIQYGIVLLYKTFGQTVFKSKKTET